METRDFDGVLALCSDDFLFAPLGTDQIKFRGYDRARAMLVALLTTCETFKYTGEVYSSEDTVVLPLRGTFGKRFEFQAADFLKIDERGRATEMVVYGRTSLPVSVLVGRVAPALSRPGGFHRWVGFRVCAWLLEVLQRGCEPLGVRWTEQSMEKGIVRARRKRWRK
jgi:hypothetical protein